MATRPGVKPHCRTKAKSCPGAGLPPKPESQPTTKSNNSNTPAPAKCRCAGSSVSLVAKPSFSPRARKAPSTAGKSTAGTIGASADSWFIRSNNSSSPSPGRCGSKISAISGVVIAITGLSAAKSLRAASYPNTCASRPSASPNSANRLRVHAPQDSRKSNSVPSLSKISASIMPVSIWSAC